MNATPLAWGSVPDDLQHGSTLQAFGAPITRSITTSGSVLLVVMGGNTHGA